MGPNKFWFRKLSGWEIDKFFFRGFTLNIFSLRNRASVWKVKPIFELYLHHFKRLSGPSTLYPIMA